MTSIRQLAFGAFVTWYLDVISHIQDLAAQQAWPGQLAKLSVLFAGLTASLFLYIIIFLPRVRGIEPDYPNWRTNELRLVVPALTISIVTGWNLLVFVLAKYSTLGFIQSIIASVGVYALGFALIGLIPATRTSAPSSKTQ